MSDVRIIELLSKGIEVRDAFGVGERPRRQRLNFMKCLMRSLQAGIEGSATPKHNHGDPDGYRMTCGFGNYGRSAIIVPKSNPFEPDHELSPPCKGEIDFQYLHLGMAGMTDEEKNEALRKKINAIYWNGLCESCLQKYDDGVNFV